MPLAVTWTLGATRLPGAILPGPTAAEKWPPFGPHGWRWILEMMALGFPVSVAFLVGEPVPVGEGLPLGVIAAEELVQEADEMDPAMLSAFAALARVRSAWLDGKLSIPGIPPETLPPVPELPTDDDGGLGVLLLVLAGLWMVTRP